MTSTEQRGIPSERIRGPPSVSIDALACIICHDVLWKPVACQTCETPFCSPCINQWLANNPSRCPNRCEGYRERKCPPFIAKLLAQLQITCFYQSNGCEQVLPYEALDNHEMECDYQFQECSGCHVQLLKKDILAHEHDCASVDWTCEICKLVCKRNEVTTKHTESICLNGQLRKLHDESAQHKQALEKITGLFNRLCAFNPELTKVTIKFDDLPSAAQECKIILGTYRGLKWTGMCYGHQSFLDRTLPNSGYVTCFTAGSSPQVAYFKMDASISLERQNERFTLVSMSVCAAWNDDLQVTITGHQDSVQTHGHTTLLRFGQPQLLLFQWRNINRIILKPLGGTAHPETGQPPLPHVIITEITIDALD